MNILILTPILPEYQALKKHLKNLRPITKENHNYEVGIFQGKHQTFQIAIRQTGSKNVTIGLATEKGIQHFDPAIVLLVGIAGGVKDVVIGDVVVGTKAYGYAAGKETADGFNVRPNVLLFSQELIGVAERVVQKGEWRHRIKDSNGQSKVFFGPIASADEVIATTEGTAFQRIKKHYNDTLAIEMESIGFAEAIFQYPLLKALNIRSISDLLDNKKKSDTAGNQELAANIAAAFAFELIYQLDFSQLQLPPMELKALVKALKENIQPHLQQVAGEPVTLPTNPYQQLLWEKIQPLIVEDLADLAEDPETVLPSIPNLLKKALREKEDLQKELSVILHQKSQANSVENPIFRDNEKVFYKSTIKAEGNLHIGNIKTINNYKKPKE